MNTDVDPTYARFWRCALQVNPFSYSQDYRKTGHSLTEDEYNKAILEQCLQLEIKVVGVADHGSVEHIDALRRCLTPRGIVVFPGFEIASTEKIHMVCLFKEGTSEAELNRYLGSLDITNVPDGTRPSKLGCLDIAARVHELGGFWYAAHILGDNGLLKLQKDGGGLCHIWRNCDCVRVAQVPPQLDGLGRNYEQILANKDPQYFREREIILINAKDIATPADLADEGATCLVKMTRPSFDAFKVAFLDPESRIRRNSSLDVDKHSSIRSIVIHGGYLDGLRVDLSDHLNTIIGGRGTGKSTLIECIRYALGIEPRGKQALRIHQDIIKENLGRFSGTVELKVVSTAQHNREFTISRRYAEPTVVRDEAGNVSQQTPSDLFPQIEFYGQNEIYELAQEQSRSKLLDRFLPKGSGDEAQLAELRKNLQGNRQRLLKALAELDETEENFGQLPKLSEQLDAFRGLGIEEKLAKSPLFAREKQIVERLRQEVVGVEEGIATLQERLPDVAFLSDRALDGLPHAANVLPMRAVLEKLRALLEQHLAALKAATVESRAELEPLRQAWKTTLAASEEDLDRTLAKLPNMDGKSGREVGTAYKELTQKIERIRPLEARLTTLRSLRDTLLSERENLLAATSDVRTQRATALGQAVKKLNKRLDGKIRIELRPEGNKSDLRKFLAESRLDGVGEKRLAWVEERDDVTPRSLAAAIREGAPKLRSAFELTPGVADAVAKIPRERLLELEELELGTFVDISLNVSHEGEPSFRPLDKLSTGQQCTAVLHLVLLDNTDPLVIDQPEDNLDNAFIADRIVRELRSAKTKRQFLFSTHNANIPVFGDAEWIGVMTAVDQAGAIAPARQGSIDVPAIRDEVANILEGGREAFMRRKEKYEF